MNAIRAVLLAMAAVFASACATTSPPDAARILAPTGTLRVALFEGNALHALRDRQSGEIRGVSHDLGKSLAARLGVAFEPVLFNDLGALLEAGRASKWDISFLAETPERAGFLDFTRNHVEVRYGYLAPAKSPIASATEVDRVGVRVAVVQRGSPDLFLTRALRHASLVRVAGLAPAVAVVRDGQADLVAGQQPAMQGLAAQLPGWRLLDGSPGSEGVAVALPKGRDPAALARVRAFVQEAKTSGEVRAAIERAALRGVVVSD
jgi:polar amino acid transport system substrate-binding protein